jgi:hypothetical protein
MNALVARRILAQVCSRSRCDACLRRTIFKGVVRQKAAIQAPIELAEDTTEMTDL